MASGQLDKKDRPARLRACLAWGMVAALMALPACQSSGPAPEDDPVEELVGSAPAREDGAPPSFGDAAGREAPGDEAEVRRGVLWYRLELDEGNARVDVRLNEPPERTSFFLPGPWAGREDFDDNIRINGARGEEGSIPFVIERDERRIDIESRGGDYVELSYTVELDDGYNRERFHPQMRNGVVFAYGPTLLLLPSDQISRQVRDIPVEVHAPEDWRVLTTWERIEDHSSREVDGGHVWGFRADDAGALRDTFVAAGASLDVERPSKSDDEAPISVGFAPDVDADRARFGESISQVVDAYRDRFGDLGAVTVYVRQVADDRQRRARGVGRRGGFVVELPAEQTLDEHALLLLAHEAFHLWNGHYLAPAPKAEPETRWFKEGVTHYVALKMLAGSGDFTQGDVLDELARSARYYQQNRAARSQPASAAERARLPYDKGVLLAVGLDASLLRQSGGRLGVEDWLTHLIDRSESFGEGYRSRDLREALVEVAGSNDAKAVEFWDAHVAGSGRLDLSELFRTAGLHWLEGARRERARLLPLDGDDTPFSAMFPTAASGADRE